MTEQTIQLACPDDRGELQPAEDGMLCSRCGRHLPLIQGILELLPKESFQELSIERVQLEGYASTFSARPEKSWLQPLRFLLALLGNGHLYGWAANQVEAAARGRTISILDAACGDGTLRRFLSHRHSYTGIDFSRRLLLRAVRYHPATYFRGDLNHLPFFDDGFDVVVSLQALQYLAHPELALREMSRVLRKNGELMLTVPNAESIKYRFQGIPQVQLQEFDLHTVLSIVSRDFDIQSLEARGLWLPFPQIPVHLPGVFAARLGLSWTVIATPRK